MRVERFEDTQASLRGHVTGFRANLMARMDRLQDKVIRFQEDMTVNSGSSDCVKRMNENTRARSGH